MESERRPRQRSRDFGTHPRLDPVLADIRQPFREASLDEEPRQLEPKTTHDADLDTFYIILGILLLVIGHDLLRQR